MRQTPRSTALTTGQVVERLLETVGGQIVACNVVAGIQNRLVDAGWVAQVLAWMGTLGSHDDLLRALDDLRMHWRPSTASPSHLPDVRLHDNGAAVPFDVEVSHILPARNLRRLMSDEDKRRLAREGLALPWSQPEVLASDMDGWQRKAVHARMVRVNPAATLGRPHDVVWFTRRATLDDALNGVPLAARAQRTRDVLGLVHHQEGDILAAMHFQPPTLSACPSARPTFADAGSNARFKAWPDDEAAREERSWGRTVDLHALSESAPSVDGCPERIAKSIDGHSLSNGATFEFELLGAVQASADRRKAADAAFARRLSGGLTVAELGAELKTLTAHTDH